MMRWNHYVTILILGVCCHARLTAQARAETAAQVFQRGGAEYLKGNFTEAEKLFRQAIGMDGSLVEAQEYLGHSLFKQEKYRDAIPVYQGAVKLDASKHALPPARRRALIDNLGMSYGINGDLEVAKAHFEAAIRNDPGYPMFYYNLACAYGELGDLDHTLSNLKAAFERKQNVNDVEKMPDPGKDDSFRRFLQDARFKQLLSEIQH